MSRRTAMGNIKDHVHDVAGFVERAFSASPPKCQRLPRSASLRKCGACLDHDAEDYRAIVVRSARSGPALATSPPSSINWRVRSRRFTTQARVSARARLRSRRCRAAVARRSAALVAAIIASSVLPRAERRRHRACSSSPLPPHPCSPRRPAAAPASCSTDSASAPVAITSSPS